MCVCVCVCEITESTVPSLPIGPSPSRSPVPSPSLFSSFCFIASALTRLPPPAATTPQGLYPPGGRSKGQARQSIGSL